MLLRVDCPAYNRQPGFIAGAEFEKRDGEWKCVRTAPILRWMESASIQNIKTFLQGPAQAKGWRYEWHK